MRPFEIGYIAFGAVVALIYSQAELFGWAGGGKERPPIAREQLRQGSPGSWNYVYWHHGYRGK